MDARPQRRDERVRRQYEVKRCALATPDGAAGELLDGLLVTEQIPGTVCVCARMGCAHRRNRHGGREEVYQLVRHAQYYMVQEAAKHLRSFSCSSEMCQTEAEQAHICVLVKCGFTPHQLL